MRALFEESWALDDPATVSARLLFLCRRNPDLMTLIRFLRDDGLPRLALIAGVRCGHRALLNWFWRYNLPLFRATNVSERLSLFLSLSLSLCKRAPADSLLVPVHEQKHNYAAEAVHVMFLTVMVRGKLDVPVTISLSGNLNPSRNTGLDDVLEKVHVCVSSFSHADGAFILASAQVNLWHSNALGGNATVSRVRRVAGQLNASRWTKMHYEAAFQQKSEDSSARYSRIREADITALVQKFAENFPINPHRDDDSSSGSDDDVCGNRQSSRTGRNLGSSRAAHRKAGKSTSDATARD